MKEGSKSVECDSTEGGCHVVTKDGVECDNVTDVTGVERGENVNNELSGTSETVSATEQGKELPSKSEHRALRQRRRGRWKVQSPAPNAANTQARLAKIGTLDADGIGLIRVVDIEREKARRAGLIRRSAKAAQALGLGYANGPSTKRRRRKKGKKR